MCHRRQADLESCRAEWGSASKEVVAQISGRKLLCNEPASHLVTFLRFHPSGSNDHLFWVCTRLSSLHIVVHAPTHQVVDLLPHATAHLSGSNSCPHNRFSSFTHCSCKSKAFGALHQQLVRVRLHLKLQRQADFTAQVTLRSPT